MITPTDKDYWRAIVLYGKNQSTYKMALSQLLINYANRNFTKIPMDELSGDFLDTYESRVKAGRPQNKTRGRQTYVEQEIHNLTAGVQSREKSLEIVKEKALKNMVLQKFHTLFNRPIPKPFYVLSDDQRYLILQDNLLNLFGDKQNFTLNRELLSRWDLLEHAFADAKHEESLEIDEKLEYVRRRERRLNLTPLIPVLNGYQQGRCFYCGESLYDPIHVDHVIPYQAIQHNEIWNLVLTHEACNEDKSDNIPPLHFIENLISRNEFVLKSELPLKEELKKVLGNTPEQRRKKIENQYIFAKKKIVRVWGGHEKYNPAQDSFYRSWIKHLGNLQ